MQRRETGQVLEILRVASIGRVQPSDSILRRETDAGT